MVWREMEDLGGGGIDGKERAWEGGVEGSERHGYQRQVKRYEGWVKGGEVAW